MKLHPILLFICLASTLFPQSLTAQEPINLYLIRGIGREAGHWSPDFLDYLQAQIPNSKLVLMDLPGSGRFHELPAKWSIGKMAEFLQSYYGDTLTHYPGSNFLLATSLAGNVALEWAHRYPDNFSGLGLVGTSLKGVCKGKKRVQPEAKKGFLDIFMTNDVVEREAKFLAINSNLHADNDSLLDTWVLIQKEHRVTRSTLMKQTVAGMMYHIPKEVPALSIAIFGSESDKIVHPDCICAVQTHLGATLFMHPDSGHGIPIDAPVWLADSFTSWATSLEPPVPVAPLVLANRPKILFPRIKNWMRVQMDLWSESGIQALGL